MSDLTPRDIRCSEKAKACVDALSSLPQAADVMRGKNQEDVYDFRGLLRAAYLAGWNESIDDLKQMIDAKWARK